MSAAELARRVVAGEVGAAARACRALDDRLPGWEGLARALHPHTGRAHVVGVTGNPGAGKSTLSDALITRWRARGARVGVVAVDPTSPFTGGAILGDRIRMQRHFEDPEVFIRSVATRGALGGLSRTTFDLVRVLDAWGAAVVLVETVGVGQDELEVTRAAHTTLVVASPGLGDEVQAIKAGLLECADVFAVNKADRDGADATVRDLELMLALGGDVLSELSRGRGHGAAGAAAVRDALHRSAAAAAAWTPPIVRTVATTGEGVSELLAGVEAHRAWLTDTEAGRERRRARAREHLLGTLRDALAQHLVAHHAAAVEALASAVEERLLDPYTAAERLMAEAGVR